MMLNLDNVVDAVLRWDFPVQDGGKVYATRPATVGELAVLEEASGGRRTMTELVATVKSLFVSKAPKVEGWGLAKLTRFIDEYSRFFAQWMRQSKSHPKAQQPVGETAAASAASGS